jgi:hypothetical protein
MLEKPEQFNALVLDELEGRMKIDPYALERGAPGERVGSCAGLRGEQFSGDYREIRLDGCAEVQITNARIGHLVVRNSVVRLVNSHVYEGVEASDARLELTAGLVAGNPPFRLEGGSLDAAGTRFESRGPIVENRGKTQVTLSLSVSEAARAGSPPRTLHEVVKLGRGRNW